MPTPRRPAQRIPDEDLSEILDRLGQGERRADIARGYGVSRGAVTRYLQRHDVPPPAAPPPVELAKLYAGEGASPERAPSLDALAERTGLPYATARRRLLAAGVTLRCQGRAPATPDDSEWIVSTVAAPEAAGKATGVAGWYAEGDETRIDVVGKRAARRLITALHAAGHPAVRRAPLSLEAEGLLREISGRLPGGYRDDLIRRAVAAGARQVDVAAAAGVSKQRIGQIVAAGKVRS